MGEGIAQEVALWLVGSLGLERAWVLVLVMVLVLVSVCDSDGQGQCSDDMGMTECREEDNMRSIQLVHSPLLCS